jgi:ferric iron reductase protein FhuF
MVKVHVKDQQLEAIQQQFAQMHQNFEHQKSQLTRGEHKYLQEMADMRKDRESTMRLMKQLMAQHQRETAQAIGAIKDSIGACLPRKEESSESEDSGHE